MAVAGIAAQLGAPDMSVSDATADLAGQPWYTLTTAFLGLAFDAPPSRLSVLDVWNDLQFAINPDGSPSDKVNPTGMGNFIAQFAGGPGHPALDPRHRDRPDRRRSGQGRNGPGTAHGQGGDRDGADDGPRGRRHHLHPALPTEYSQAFDDLPFGVVDKIGIAFTSDIFGGAPANTT